MVLAYARKINNKRFPARARTRLENRTDPNPQITGRSPYSHLYNNCAALIIVRRRTLCKLHNVEPRTLCKLHNVEPRTLCKLHNVRRAHVM